MLDYQELISQLSFVYRMLFNEFHFQRIKIPGF